MSLAEARVVVDSVGPHGRRLTTFALTYPRFIHAEFLTHRSLSRNTASSRAVPVRRRVRRPAVVPSFAADRRGMTAGGPLPQHRELAARAVWTATAFACRVGSWTLSRLGAHKQWANRPLEWALPVDVIATGDDIAWGQFLRLRDHADAQPEMRDLAAATRAALKASTPRVLEAVRFDDVLWKDVDLTADEYAASWHAPFVSVDAAREPLRMTLARSVAKVARVSYERRGDEDDPAGEGRTFERMRWSEPLHASPFESVAVCIAEDRRVRNFRGYVQYRALIDGEGL